MKRIVVLLGIILTGVMLFGCAPKGMPAEQLVLPEAQKNIAKEAWSEQSIGLRKAEELEWDKTLSGGIKEGKVVLFTTLGPTQREALSQGFKNRTNIELDVVVGRGGEISAKLTTERRNGLFLADVYLGGNTTLVNLIKPSGALAPVKPVLFLPEVLEPSLWYRNTLPWLDKDQLMLQMRMMPGGRRADAAFMRGSIDKKEFTSYYDLLKPQLKGRMNIQDPTGPGKGGVGWVNKALTYYGLNWDYMKALAGQDLFATRDKRIQIEWVVRGKHLLAISPDEATIYDFQALGVPLDSLVFKEAKDILGGGSSVISLIDRAPHPNAAKLFINWFLSKEGQTIFSRAYGIQSARMDIPTDHLTPDNIRQPGVDYPVETEEFVLQEEKLLPKVIEIFSALIK